MEKRREATDERAGYWQVQGIHPSRALRSGLGKTRGEARQRIRIVGCRQTPIVAPNEPPTRFHPFAQALRRALRSAKPDDEGFLRVGGSGVLSAATRQPFSQFEIQVDQRRRWEAQLELHAASVAREYG
jgi:hypothetical protein